jgi:hypothetical protein
MKTFEMIVPSAQNGLEIIDRYSHLVSIFANNAWFPHDDNLEIKLTHSLELSPVSWLVQLSAHNQCTKNEIMPGLVTVIINTDSSHPNVFEFLPIHVIDTAKAGFYEVKIFDTETIIGHPVYGVIPAFDCIIEKHTRSVCANVIIKLFIQYLNNARKIISRVEMPLEVSSIIQGANGLNWWPQNYKSLIYVK